MILLDTNVMSEGMKPAPDDAVRAWLDEQAAETLFLSSVTIAELMFGIGALPDGKRKDRLAEALEGVMELIAAAKGFAVATRDSSAFDAANVTVIDPWKAGR